MITLSILLLCCAALSVYLLVARLYLSGADLSAFDADRGQRFASDRPESPAIAAAMARLTPSNTPPPGLNKQQRLAFKRDKFNHMFDDLQQDARFIAVAAGAIGGEWVLAPGADPARRMLYIHGGGFVVGSPRSHRPITARMSAACGGAVFAVDYRLLPEYKRIDGIEDCRAAYRYVLEHGPYGAAPAQKLFVAGDSAGGNLTLSLLAWARDQGMRAADAAIAIAPPSDATWSSPSILRNVDSDYMLGPAIRIITRLPRSLTLWLNWLSSGIRPNDPLISPVFGDLSGLPPLLVQVSETEMLYDDARRYVNRARAAGSQVALQSWNRTLHVWHIFHAELPEAAEAFAEIARFIERVAPTHKATA
ncbi:MAG: Alpha/beta hydrolase fold-3 [Massilia sp.]|nr:Alpha/beta hydrolase fold-3 [Massilia sp.]